MNNAQLRKIVQHIEVDKEGNVDIYLRLLSELGIRYPVSVEDKTDNGAGAVAQTIDDRT